MPGYFGPDYPATFTGICTELAIQHFCAVIAVFLNGSLIQVLLKYVPSPFETRAGILIFILPLLLMVLVYAIGKKILIKLTIHNESSYQVAQADRKG